MPERASRFVTFRASGSGIETVRVLVGDGGVRIVDGFGGWEVVSRPRKTAMTLWRGYQPLTLEIPVLFKTDSREWDDGKRIEGDCIALGMMAGRGEPAPEPRKRNNKVVTYTIKKGDSYAKIARAKKVDLADLLQLNGIKDPAKLTRGKKLAIPESDPNVPFGQPPVIELTGEKKDQYNPLIPYNDLSVDSGSVQFNEWVIQDIEWEAATRNLYGDRIRQAATVTVLQYVAPKVAATKTAPWRRNAKKSRKGKQK